MDSQTCPGFSGNGHKPKDSWLTVLTKWQKVGVAVACNKKVPNLKAVSCNISKLCRKTHTHTQQQIVQHSCQLCRAKKKKNYWQLWPDYLSSCLPCRCRLMMILLPPVPAPKIKGIDPEMLKVFLCLFCDSTFLCYFKMWTHLIVAPIWVDIGLYVGWYVTITLVGMPTVSEFTFALHSNHS